MNNESHRLYEAAKALIVYTDKEGVFDKSADMGCGGYDTYQSETLYNLIADAKKALKDFEAVLNKPA